MPPQPGEDTPFPLRSSTVPPPSRVVPLFAHLFFQFLLVYQPVFETYEAVGFSQPLAALVGSLPLALVAFQSRVGELRWPLLPAVLLFAGGGALAMARLFDVGASALFMGTLGVLGLGWTGGHLVRTDAFETREGWMGYALATLFALLVYAFALQGLFGGDDVGAMVGHLAGFLPGFLLALVVLWGFSLAKPEHGLALDLE